MSTPRLDDARLREIAAGDALEAAEAEALLASPEARERLAASDPSALFAALGAVPVDTPPMPSLEALPPRAGSGAARNARASGAHRPVRRMVFGLAAASLAMACLLALTRAPEQVPAVLKPAAGPALHATASWPPLVERVQSPTAQIVALVPPSAEGPTVTLILDEEVDP